MVLAPNGIILARLFCEVNSRHLDLFGCDVQFFESVIAKHLHWRGVSGVYRLKKVVLALMFYCSHAK